MKEALEKFDLGEILAHLCPGTILLVSVLLWIEPRKLAGLAAEKETWQEFTLGAFSFILAYTLGLVVALWSSAGSILFLRLSLMRKAGIGTFGNAVLFRILWLLHWFPQPVFTRSLVEARLRIAETLNIYSGLRGLTDLQTPWDWLTLFRVLAADRLGERAKHTIAFAGALHRRFRFAQGVALATSLIALQCAIRLLLQLVPNWDRTLPHVEIHGMVALLILGGMTSFVLRWVAGHLLQEEFLLTSSLTAWPNELVLKGDTTHEGSPKTEISEFMPNQVTPPEGDELGARRVSGG